jgi:hypothetical protein
MPFTDSKIISADGLLLFTKAQALAQGAVTLF